MGAFGYPPGSPWALSQEEICAVPLWCPTVDIDQARYEAQQILLQEDFDFGDSYLTPFDAERFEQPEYALFFLEQLDLLNIKHQALELMGTRQNPSPDLSIFRHRMDADDPNLGMGETIQCIEGYYPVLPELCRRPLQTLFEQAEIELNHEKRKYYSKQIELSIVERYYDFPLFWEIGGAAYWNDVKGYSHFNTSNGSYRKFMHLWKG